MVGSGSVYHQELRAEHQRLPRKVHTQAALSALLSGACSPRRKRASAIKPHRQHQEFWNAFVPSLVARSNGRGRSRKRFAWFVAGRNCLKRHSDDKSRVWPVSQQHPKNASLNKPIVQPSVRASPRNCFVQRVAWFRLNLIQRIGVQPIYKE